jgi:hypothetical protein
MLTARLFPSTMKKLPVSAGAEAPARQERISLFVQAESPAALRDLMTPENLRNIIFTRRQLGKEN